MDVTVVGSLHLDIVVDAPQLPMRDETLMGSAWHRRCGGKGGNQAVAAARFGARVGFGGRTGNDDFGRTLRTNLEAHGVDASHVQTDHLLASGMSVAIVEAAGEYGAVVVSGANQGLDATKVVTDWRSLWNCKVLLLQNEIPEAINLASARAAKVNGARIILNAAPARQASPDLLACIDVLVVNRVEAAMLSGCADNLDLALAKLHAPTRDVVITRGGDGILLALRTGETQNIPVLPVRLVSSHGAGDFFCGVLAVRLATGDDIAGACAYARTAAGLFVSRSDDQRYEIDDAKIREATRTLS